MSHDPEHNPRASAYFVDTQPGYHRYVNVEGVGECRELFAQMVQEMDEGKMDVVVAAKASLFFVDTSPMWIEKFIATAQRRGILVADAESGREYDLRLIDDETAFRACGGS
jgi:hypothetical protein